MTDHTGLLPGVNRLIDEAFLLDTEGIRGLQVSRRPELT